MTEWLALAQEERFRQNEAVRGAGVSGKALPGPFAFRCECTSPRCTEFAIVDAEHLHLVRANPQRLILATGHHTDQQTIMHMTEHFAIVELAGRAQRERANLR